MMREVVGFLASAEQYFFKLEILEHPSPWRAVIRITLLKKASNGARPKKPGRSSAFPPGKHE
jgi:hypothetical protein